MTDKPTTIEDRLRELAGPDNPEFTAHVRQSMCPCLAGKDCLWPRCPKLGNGIGHHP
jgi:hypothetical protein